MVRRIFTLCCLFVLAGSFLMPVTTRADKQHGESVQHYATATSFPHVDPNYIYTQLFYLTTHFQHREAGYDDNLPINVNGHDEFAQYWAQEIMKDLQDFGPQVLIDKFPVRGWKNRPATVPAFNVEVSVSGMTEPEQVVVVGCHYDGETVSTQSANDDTSGCAIALGVAKAMGDYWRSNHLYPARTLRFVLFDAEEQGIFGSFHYVNSTMNGNLGYVTAMFNEEQSGIAYPVRFLGKQANPLLPLHVDLTPSSNANNYFLPSDVPTAQQFAHIAQFRALMQQGVPAVFEQFRELGYASLTYHSTGGQDVPQAIFTPDQLSNIIQEDDTIPSDETSFIEAGIPCATFGGNATYYDKNPPPPAWSYPFDQPQDTIQLMNTFANGSSNQSQALSLALALPGMLTTWMLNQPGVLGQAQDIREPVTSINDISPVLVGHVTTFSAMPALYLNSVSKAASYLWNFGDGSTAQGISVRYTYVATGNYPLTLTVTSEGKTRSVFQLMTVATQPVTYPDYFTAIQFTGHPKPNPLVTLPRPDNRLTDRIIMSSETITAPPSKTITKVTPGTSSPPTGIIIAIGAIIVLLAIGGVGFYLRRRKTV